MANKAALLLAIVACVALSLASAQELYEYHYEVPDHQYEGPILVRQGRSPQKGSVRIDYNQDRYGKRAGVEYNHNLHTSRDGRFKVDAYGQASRDFTHNRNDYGGGVRGSWRF